jgi:hypothetical protein
MAAAWCTDRASISPDAADVAGALLLEHGEEAVADKLLVYSDVKQSAAEGMAGLWSIAQKDQKEVEDLDGIVKAVSSYSALDEFVIFAHGPSGLTLETASYALTDADVAKAFAKVKTTIQHVRFEGCWVGELPADMAVFGQLLKAKDVSGFTWASWTNSVTINIPKAITAADLSKFLKAQNLERWLMPGSPSVPILASMARSAAVSRDLPMLWYQYGLDEKPPYVDDNFNKLGRHKYAARGDAAKKTVTAKKAVNSTAPTSPFEYVTVTM